MMLTKSITIGDFLKRENNNLDLFRIIAACMVIIGHSYVLFPDPGEEDQIRILTGFTYSGALAVKIFFFISGLVVTNSIITSNSVIHFTISRLFRIFPALIFLCLITVFLLGPALSSLNSSEYFNSPQTYSYLKNNILLKTEYNLPGVFAHNPYANAVNGSLWTLPEEVGCYLFLLAIFAIGVFKNKKMATLLFALLIIDMILPQRVLTYWKSDISEISLLPASFACGAILAINKDRISISALQPIGFTLLTFLLWKTKFVELIFCITLFSSIIFLAQLPFILKLKIKNDISYGVYLWGFTVQQALQNFVSGQTVYLKMIISLAISIGLAYLSWFLIEKRFIGYGKFVLNKLNTKFRWTQ